eukprot:contig_5454_g1233
MPNERALVTAERITYDLDKMKERRKNWPPARAVSPTKPRMEAINHTHHAHRNGSCAPHLPRRPCNDGDAPSQ